MLKAELSFKGKITDNHLIEFYDAAQAMLGFQRTLALTTHLVLNDEIITQAPALKGAEIFLGVASEGSIKIPAFVKATAIATGLYTLGSTSSDNPIGHIIFSAYDYVVSQSLGFHVDYDESLGETYERLEKGGKTELPILDQSRFDSLIEKCEGAIIGMHRPVVKSETASSGQIAFSAKGRTLPISGGFDRESYSYIAETKQENKVVKIRGKVSSYNINTFKGRVFCSTEGRPIPFELGDVVRSRRVVGKITASLRRNAINHESSDADLILEVYRNTSVHGRLKGYFVVGVSEPGKV